MYAEFIKTMAPKWQSSGDGLTHHRMSFPQHTDGIRCRDPRSCRSWIIGTIELDERSPE